MAERRENSVSYFKRNLIEQKGKTDFPAKFMWREGANDRFDLLLELVMI